jgi:hypothetical protein
MHENEFMSMELTNTGGFDQFRGTTPTTMNRSIANGKNRAKKVSMGMSSSEGFGMGAVPPLSKELSMDDVLDKIRRNRGDRQTWTDDKLRELTKSR